MTHSNSRIESAPAGQKPRRPLGLTIVGIVAIVSGILSLPSRLVGVTIVAIAVGILSLFGGTMGSPGITSGPIGLALIVLVFGFLGLGLGAALILEQPWARTSTIIVYLLSIPLGIAEIFYGGNVGDVGGIIRVVGGILIPIYLTRPSPRAFFQRK